MNRAIQQSLYYAAGLVLMKGVSFIMLPIVAGALSTTDYGQLDLWLSVLNVGGIILGFGLIEALYKQAGDAKGNAFDVLNTTATLQQLIIAAWALIAALPIGVFVLSTWTEISTADYVLVTLTLIVSCAINMPLTWLRLIDNARLFFLLTSSKAVIQAVLTFVFLQYGLGLTGVLLSGFISSLYLAALLLIKQRRALRFNWDAQIAKQMRHYGLPLIFSGSLLFVAAGAERWILAATVGLDTLAQYAIAMQFALIIAFLCEPLTLWWFPKRFQILNEQNGKAKTVRIAETICHSTIWFAMSVALIAPVIIEHWFPVRYHEASQWIPWLALGIAFKQISHTLTTGCYIEKQPKVVLKINSIMAIAALGLFTLASLLVGIQGVVMAFVMLYALRALLFDRASQQRLALKHRYSQLIIHLLLVISFIALNQLSPLYLLVGWLIQTVLFSLWLAQNWRPQTTQGGKSILAQTLAKRL
ncbi:lipopolysaccharide biosynthesis protein [Vibrio sp. 10N]|uniref:lipopolysaccharide biosynthesis protein n=1 Tax=Vibrio sp. 10N TaxID=3058938 RepID=UPI002812C40B|nr:oligosaccharide flippase family protein [Vibrio sp. 10N]